MLIDSFKSYRKSKSRLTLNKSALIHLIFRVLMPVLIGCCIYIFFRKPILTYNNWLSYLDMSIPSIRIDINLPEFILYNLPDGLWAYSLVYSIIWVNQNANDFLFKILLGIAIAIVFASEFLQLTGTIAGTFDIMDLAFLSIGIFLGIISNIKLKTNDI